MSEETNIAANDGPKSLLLAQHGIHTANQFAGVFSAMIGDVLSGAISPGVTNAACNAGGKLLKVVEMQQKYGTKGPGARKQLELCDVSGQE